MRRLAVGVCRFVFVIFRLFVSLLHVVSSVDVPKNTESLYKNRILAAMIMPNAHL